MRKLCFRSAPVELAYSKLLNCHVSVFFSGVSVQVEDAESDLVLTRRGVLFDPFKRLVAKGEGCAGFEAFIAHGAILIQIDPAIEQGESIARMQQLVQTAAVDQAPASAEPLKPKTLTNSPLRKLSRALSWLPLSAKVYSPFTA